jgi:hypothetical protein
MLTWDDLRSRGMACRRCRSTHPIAGPLSPVGRQRVTDAIESNRVIDAIRLVREDTGAGLAEAKGFYQHLVRKVGQCHWCAAELPDNELTDCPGCRALNIRL